MFKKIIFFTLIIATAIGCSDNSTGAGDDGSEDNDNVAATGTLEVDVSTTGDGTDEDGYTVNLDDSDSEPVEANGTVTFEDLEEDTYSIALSEIADHCSVNGDNPLSAQVVADETTTVSFSVECESQGPEPLSNKIAYESSGEGGGYSKVYVMEEDGSNPQMLHEIDGSNVLQPDVSPDGRYIVFSAGGFDNYIYVMGSDGSEITQLTTDEDDANDYDPVWSPDGSEILFERGEDIYVMNADGSEQQNLTNTPDYFEEDPAWSPNGEEIVYVRGVDDSFSQDEGNLYIMNADGSEPSPLTETAADIDRAPSWSPDGSQIAFSRRVDGDVPEIFLIDVDGDNPEQITEMPDGTTDYSNREPAWSPDGNRIAFTGYRSSGTYIHIIDADGSNEVILENGTINQGSASWSPLED